MINSAPKFTTGQKTVTAAGTAETLPEIKTIQDGCEITIKSMKTNTGYVEISVNDGTNDTASTPFVLDDPKDSIQLRVKNTSNIQVDVEVSGDGVEYIVEMNEIR